MTSIEHLVSRQIERWEKDRHGWVPSPEREGEGEIPPSPVLAINPQLGCGSRRVVNLLSRRTGYEVLGFSLIDKVAENLGIRTQLIDHMDESQRSYVRNWIESMIRERYVEENDYVRCLLQILHAFALQGGCILIGRGSPFVVERGQGLRVRMVQPMPQRIANVMHYYKLGASEAEKRIRQSDHERAEFARRYFQRDIDDPDNYDLTINLERHAPETAVGVILRGLELLQEGRPARFGWQLGPQEAEVVISRQIEKWERNAEVVDESMWAEMLGRDQPPHRHPVIAFSPKFCSGSRRVATVLASRLGYEIFGYKLIDRIAEDLNLSPRIIDRLDQRARSRMQAMIERLSQGASVANKDYFESLVKIIRALIEQGGVHLIGRGSCMLVEENEGLRVRLTQPMEGRLRNMQEFYGISGDKGRERLERVDRERAEFIRQYFQADNNDMDNYDLALNLERMTPVSAADIIQRAMEPLYL